MKQIKKIFLIGVASYLMMHGYLNAQAGKTGLAFLKYGVGGRALGMGEAYSAVADDPSATFYNPAALSCIQSPQILLMHREWIQDVKTDFMAATSFWNNLYFGVSVNSTSISNIELRSIAGPMIGTFNARNASIGLSTAYEVIPSLSLGLTGKFLFEKIYVEEASGYGIDFGGIYRTPWDVQIAFTVNNLGSMSILQNEATKLPAYVRAGGAYQIALPTIEGTLLLASDVLSFTGEGKTHMHLGAELDYRNLLAVRFGYQTGYEAKDFSTGIGIHYSMFQLDYAFVPFRSDLGQTHTISLGIAFK